MKVKGWDFLKSSSKSSSLPWRRKWQPTPVFLPGKSHGWRSLTGYSPWGRQESDTTEQLHFLSFSKLALWCYWECQRSNAYTDAGTKTDGLLKAPSKKKKKVPHLTVFLWSYLSHISVTMTDFWTLFTEPAIQCWTIFHSNNKITDDYHMAKKKSAPLSR